LQIIRLPIGIIIFFFTFLFAAFFQSNDNNDYYRIWLCLSKLQNDNDRDVRDLAKVLPLPENISLQLLNDMAVTDMNAEAGCFDETRSPANSDNEHEEEDEKNKSLYGLFNQNDEEDEEDALVDFQFDINFTKSAGGVTSSNKNVDDVTIMFASSGFENDDSLFSFNDDDTNCNDELPPLSINSLPPPPPPETNDCDSNKNFDFNLSSSPANTIIKKEVTNKKI
jgi:hypothetical protein